MNSLKCVVVGDSGVGKTSMVMSYTQNAFPETVLPTVFDTHNVSLSIKGVSANYMSLWDTAGQETYDRLRPLSYPETDVFIVCFSIACPTSYSNVQQKWFPELRHHAPRTPMILVGTKLDLRDNAETVAMLRDKKQRPVSQEQGEKMSNTIQAVRYLECSALTRSGVSSIFTEAAIVGSNKAAIANGSRPNRLIGARRSSFTFRCNPL